MKEAQDIIRQLKNGDIKPVYVLSGDEPYYIDQVVDFAEHKILDESERDFNLTILYGSDTEVMNIVDAARRFPMMAERQVIIVKEAHLLKDLNALEGYMKDPTTTTALFLAFRGGKVDRRKKWFTLAKKQGTVLNTKALYDNQVPAWIKEYLERKKYKITDKSAHLITEFLGADLGKIANELEKLMVALPEGHTITDNDVEYNIGISKDYNTFELSNALFSRDTVKAFRIARYFGDNHKQHPIYATIPALHYSFSRLLMYQTLKDKSDASAIKTLGVAPFILKSYKLAARNYKTSKTAKIIGYLHETDLKSKGIGAVTVSEGELLKELVFKILN